MNQQEENKFLASAEYFFRANNYEYAQTLLNKVISSNPNNSKANELLAYITGNTGNGEQAHQYLVIACEQVNCSPEAVYYLGSSHLKFKKYQEAIACFQKVIDIAGESFEAFHDMGTAQALMGDKKAALASYLKAAVYKIDSHEIHFNIAKIQHDFNNFEEALGQYDRALQLKPDFAEAWSNKAITLQKLNRYNEASAHHDKAIQIRPDMAKLYLARGMLHRDLGNTAQAIQDMEFAISHNTESLEYAQFVLAALQGGQTPKQMPKDVAADIFDKYAEGFEHSLLDALKYRSPNILYSLIKDSLGRNLGILDLGCGTGLMGELLKPHASELTGVDLSIKMLEIAESKGIYDKLLQADANDFLSTCEHRFDLVVSTDVFVYIGDLSDIFTNLQRLVRKKGRFCFTVEKLELGNYYLSPKTLRYSHSKEYLQTLAGNHDFNIEILTTEVIRQESEIDVPGYYVVLEKKGQKD